MKNHERTLKPGLRFGDWTLQEFLGSGGNGDVWKVVGGERHVGAMKFLQERHWSDRTRYGRFQDEVAAQKQCQDIPGVLKLLDECLPDSPDRANPPWLVSTLAHSVSEELNERRELRRVVEACSAFARILTEMHARGVSHRDIKPGNLFWAESAWAVGDFGLADFRDKAARTTKGERIGPLYYHAPEMLEASDADGAAADVWSLAKTLWVLATGQRYPLPGQHFSTVPALTVSEWVADNRAWRLDRVLEMATAIAPAERISMKAFCSELDSWLQPRIAGRAALDLDHLADTVHSLNTNYAINQAANIERSSTFNDCVRRIREFAGDAVLSIAKQLEHAGFSHCFPGNSRAADPHIQAEKHCRIGGPGASATCGTPTGSTVQLSISIHVKSFNDGRTVAETIHSVGLPSPRGRDWKTLYSHARDFQCNCPSEDAAFAEVVATCNNQFQQSVARFLEIARSK